MYTDTQTYISRVWMACSHLLQYWKHPLQLHNGWIFSILFCYGSWLRARYISTRNNSITHHHNFTFNLRRPVSCWSLQHLFSSRFGRNYLVADFIAAQDMLVQILQNILSVYPRLIEFHQLWPAILVRWWGPTLLRRVNYGWAGLGWQFLQADDANVSLITRLDIVWSLGWIN